MVVKRLVDAALFGFGASAGKKLFDEAIAEKPEPREPSEAERREALANADKAAREEAKRRATEAKRAAAEAKTAKAKREAEIDRELAALKRKLGKSQGP